MASSNDRQVGGQHYNTPIQHWDLVVANDIPYLEAQIIKYVMRHRRKNELQDLQKAQHFIEKLVEVTYPLSLSAEQNELVNERKFNQNLDNEG